MKNICTIKPGDTLFLECTVTEDDGTTPLIRDYQLRGSGTSGMTVQINLGDSR